MSEQNRELELDRIALYWEDQARKGCVDAFQCALREAWNCASRSHSPAPIPEQVAQGEFLDAEVIKTLWKERGGDGVPAAFRFARAIEREVLATQSAKQSNLQEENRQLRQRIEDLTTAANQCINDAIGQSAKEVAQQAAKAETAEQADEKYERAAILKLSLRADSGYMADETHRISADQWGRILIIANEKASDLAPTTSTVSASGADGSPA